MAQLNTKQHKVTQKKSGSGRAPICVFNMAATFVNSALLICNSVCSSVTFMYCVTAVRCISKLFHREASRGFSAAASWASYLLIITVSFSKWIEKVLRGSPVGRSNLFQHRRTSVDFPISGYWRPPDDVIMTSAEHSPTNIQQTMIKIVRKQNYCCINGQWTLSPLQGHKFTVLKTYFGNVWKISYWVEFTVDHCWKITFLHFRR